MSRAFPIRRVAGIISALALGTAAPAASANPVHRASAGPAATARTASVRPCNPFSLTLQICAIGPAGISYGVPSASSTPSAQPTPVRVVTHSNGFDWGYGAIGAATLVLVGIGVGGVRVATHSRARHAATS